MRTRKNNKGFTMAELLIAVAIIVVLMGVAFIAVPNYQRSSTRLEYDGIAKEIFIAAQNHLTTAQGQGYLQLGSDAEKVGAELGKEAASDADTQGDEYYFTYNKDSSPYSNDPQNPKAVIDLMLPFGSIDETIRAGGTYIIRYQPSSGRVLDVFYSLPGRSSLLTVTGFKLSEEDYDTLMSDCRGDENRRNREHFTGTNGTGVVGWYGGEEGLPVGIRLEDPELIVHNEDVLWVEVKDNNADKTEKGSLQLIITGVTSGAQKSFDLRTIGGRVESGTGTGKINVILDDITRSGMHFAALPSDTTNSFIPGENIIVEAVAYNNTALTNVAYSGRKTTNSLFAEIAEEKTKDPITGDDTIEHVVLVENFRHFENLHRDISDFKHDGAVKNGETAVTISKARQVTDLIWTEEAAGASTEKPKSFVEAVEYITGTKPVSIFNKYKTAVTTQSRFYPVSPDYKLEYEGQSNDQNHKVSNVKADHGGAAGLFGTMITGSSVSNLELIDFNIKSSSGNAGALVGTATGGTEGKEIKITNVLAHNSAEGYTANVTASSGDAGGLIGSATNCTVSKSAAALTVNGSGSAGGLIGSASATTVSASYSGGHTYSDAPDYTGMTQPDPARTPYPARYYNDKNEPIYNVTGGTTAGGLIGSAGNSTISNCYSTCSATGEIAGGFVGTSTGSISNSYCTGLVKGTGTENVTTDGKTKTMPKDGAFAYSVGRATNCQYFEIINERQNVDEKDSTKPVPGYHYLTALGGGSTNPQITPFDGNTTSYNNFSGAPGAWKDAYPYDSGLKEYYHDKNDPNKYEYNLETVEQLGAKLEENDDDKTVYFVKDHYGDWPAPEEFIFNAPST